MQSNKLVLIRHGESIWNNLNQFTGWEDVKLSHKGKEEAKLAGKLLKNKEILFDCCYTSLLKRAINTLWIVLNELDQCWLPVVNTWRLNERHYGKLQGLNKNETILKYGIEQVNKWRRSFTEIPPKIDDVYHNLLCKDRRYCHLKKSNIPTSESLELTLNRVIPFLENEIFKNLKIKKTILIVAHGNSLRAIIKYLSKLNNDEISKLNIPTGIPIIYNFNHEMNKFKYSFIQNDH